MKATALKRLTNNLAFCFCMIIGGGAGYLVVNSWPSIKLAILAITPMPPLYLTSNELLKIQSENAAISPLTWTALIPQKEQDVIAYYQAPNNAPAPSDLKGMTAQILRSIEAATDPDYQEALMSTNTVSGFEKQIVSISGFIVPIDFYANKTVKNLFLVPYFGACIHFPAPPPNQIIFIQLEAGFQDVDITQAYTLIGEINLGLFEDPMGTSAYTLDVVSIIEFNGQPDDLRLH
jgi:hypothetical protein